MIQKQKHAIIAASMKTKFQIVFYLAVIISLLAAFQYYLVKHDDFEPPEWQPRGHMLPTR